MNSLFLNISVININWDFRSFPLRRPWLQLGFFGSIPRMDTLLFFCSKGPNSRGGWACLTLSHILSLLHDKMNRLVVPPTCQKPLHCVPRCLTASLLSGF